MIAANDEWKVSDDVVDHGRALSLPESSLPTIQELRDQRIVAFEVGSQEPSDLAPRLPFDHLVADQPSNSRWAFFGNFVKRWATGMVVSVSTGTILVQSKVH